MSDVTQSQKSTGELQITVTDSAVNELKRLMELEKEENLFLRVGISSGGCSGMSYAMAFDTNITENDQLFNFNDLQVRVDKNALVYLNGAIIDYDGGMLGGGFKFSNPNARRSCGCGTSFSC